MANESLKDRAVFFWSKGLVAMGCWTSASILVLFFSCCSIFPTIPVGLWIASAVTSAANRIPIGWIWRNTWRLNAERVLFACTLSSFIIAMTDRTAFHQMFWSVSAFIACVWAVYYSIICVNSGKEYPLKNRIFGTFMGLFSHAPLVAACLSALRYSS